MTTLAPCSACRRHVRVDETACPFCGTRFSAPARGAEPTTRLGRAAMFAFRATTVAALGALPAACGNDAAPTPPPSTMAPPTTGGPRLPEGPPPPPSTTIAQPYGAPPIPEPPPPTTTTEPPPPTTDAEERHTHRRRLPDDPGTVHALYGAPVSAYGAAPPDGLDGLE